MVLGFIRGPSDHSRVLYVSLGSFVGVGFTRARYGCRWELLGSLASGLRVVGLCRVFCVPCGSLSSSEVVCFTRARPGFHWLHQRAFCTVACALESLCTTWVLGFTHVCSGGRWVRSGPFGSLTYTLRLVLFIGNRSVYSLVLLWLLGSLLPSLELVGYIRVAGFTR